MGERMYRLEGDEPYRELDPVRWFQWYRDTNRMVWKREIDDGIAVVVFSGRDDSDEDPPRLWEARIVRNLPNGMVEENAWRLRTPEEAIAKAQMAAGLDDAA